MSNTEKEVMSSLTDKRTIALNEHKKTMIEHRNKERQDKATWSFITGHC